MGLRIQASYNSHLARVVTLSTSAGAPVAWVALRRAYAASSTMTYDPYASYWARRGDAIRAMLMHFVPSHPES